MSDSTSESARRVALIANASFFVGPPIARLLAERGHDLVIGDPADGLVDELEGKGATVEVVQGVGNSGDANPFAQIVEAGLKRFGKIDAATMFSGRVVTGRFMDSSTDDLKEVVQGCIELPYHFLKAVTAPLVERQSGQILVLTSAAGARPTNNAPLYSAARAGANMLIKNVAREVARTGVQVNAVGTNFMDFPEFLRASGGNDPEVRARIEAAVPMKRLGTVEECAAFCMAFLDGTSGFTTGQFVAYAGGWA
ncbi:MAG: SDR family oxidoreductase [Chloroflexi bacterium]|nr:SDR family oxidoreductase [Chloroflexota bacterium]